MNENKTQTEFELFYWQLLQHKKHLSQQEQDQDQLLKHKCYIEKRCKIFQTTPLGKSDYTIINTPNFINRPKKERIRRKYKIISFDVKSFFINVPLDETISIILRKIYDEGKIETNIQRNLMKELLLLCTKHVHFTFVGDIYIQLGGVAMGSPLGSLLANVFMCSLEESIVPTLKDCLVHWRRYVDDTHAYIEPDKIDYVMKKLNTYHKQIQFTYELEKDQRISFLDVSIRRLTKMENLKQQFLRKRQTQIYTDWNSHGPIDSGKLAH